MLQVYNKREIKNLVRQNLQATIEKDAFSGPCLANSFFQSRSNLVEKWSIVGVIYVQISEVCILIKVRY